MVSILAPQRQTSVRRRRRGACQGCRRRKTRCDGGHPCSQCERYDEACKYNNSLSSYSTRLNFGHGPIELNSYADLSLDLSELELLRPETSLSVEDGFHSSATNPLFEESPHVLPAILSGSSTALQSFDLPQRPPSPALAEFEDVDLMLGDYVPSSKIIDSIKALESHCQLSGGFDSGRQSVPITPLTWPTAAAIQVLTEAAFSVSTSFMNLIVGRDNFNSLADAVTAGRDQRPDACVLVTAVLSMGASSQKYRSYPEFTATFTAESMLGKSFEYYETLGTQCSVDQLQCLAALAVCSLHNRHCKTGEVLGKAVQCIQKLRLNGGNCIPTGVSPVHQNNVLFAFWVIYCTEKQSAMLQRVFSLFADTWVDHSWHQAERLRCYDEAADPGKRWLLLQIEYAEICAKVVGIAWNRSASPQSSPQQRKPTTEVVRSLYQWQERLPGSSKWTAEDALDGTVLDGQSLAAFCQFHSAIMSLDKIIPFCDGTLDCVSPNALGAPSAQSARTVLTASLYMRQLGSHCTRHFVSVAIEAICIVVKWMLRDHSNPECKFLFQMACGYFSGIKDDRDGAVSQVIALLKDVQTTFPVWI